LGSPPSLLEYNFKIFNVMKKTFSEIQASSLNGRRLLWSASLLSLCVLPACSDSDDDDLPQGGEKNAPVLTTSTMEVNADAEAQAQRVTNFNISGTRAALDESTDVKTLQAGEKLPATIEEGVTYIVSGDVEAAATTVTVKGGLKSTETANLSGINIVVDGGTLEVAKLIAPSLTVKSGAATIGEGTLIANDITVEGGKLIVSGNARTVANLVVSGEAEVAVAAAKTLTVDQGVKINSKDAKFTSTSAAYSYITAENLTVADEDLTKNFGFGYYAVGAKHIKKVEDGTAVSVAASDLELPATLYLTATDTKLEAWKETTGTETTVLKQISKVEVPEEGLSATGIAVNGQNVYISYHTRGTGVNGAIDVATFNGTKATPVKTLKSTSSNNIEFNYITVAGGKVYAVGTRDNVGLKEDGITSKTGYNGVIGVVDPSDNSLSTRSLVGGDGNGIILNGDYLHVASVYGVETYVTSNLRRVSALESAGHVKSIVKDGNKIVTLSYSGAVSGDNAVTSESAYTDKDNNKLVSVPFAINTYASTDITLAAPTAYTGSFGVSALVPTYGKNTIAVDGSTYYVAAGANGVARSDGQTFQVARAEGSKSTVPAGYANCVAVDANYVYVAYGSAGVYVLDKTKFPTVVASYENAAGKSANFVTAADGYIYVAYGQDSWQVLQLTTVKK
jgi:hypothetical protein